MAYLNPPTYLPSPQEHYNSLYRAQEPPPTTIPPVSTPLAAPPHRPVPPCIVPYRAVPYRPDPHGINQQLRALPLCAQGPDHDTAAPQSTEASWSIPPDVVDSALLQQLFKLMNDREPGALRDSGWLYKRRLYAAVAQQLLSDGAPKPGAPIDRSSPAWTHTPKYGQVYFVSLKVAMEDLETAAKQITATDSGVEYADSLHAWARAWLALPVGQRRLPWYVGMTMASLHVRFDVGAFAHLSANNPSLLGKLLRWLQEALGPARVHVDVSLVFTSAQIEAAVTAAVRYAEDHSIQHGDLAIEHVLGFAEQTAASWCGTQLRLGGLNVAPTGLSPPHPNSEPERLLQAVAIQLRCRRDAARKISVLEAVKTCRTSTTSWSSVEALLDRFAGPDEREAMTIGGLMTAIGRYGGG